MKYLVIDCCSRAKSRTRKLYKEYLKTLDGDIKILELFKLKIKPINKAYIDKRDALLRDRNYDDPIFDLAKDFITYDEIIVAAPYWDLSFPSLLKVYFEHTSVSGITFGYVNGVPTGFSKAKRLMYFSTAGGPVNTHLGFEYTKALTSMWGIKEFHNYCIDNLDIDPTQEKKLMREGIKRIMKEIKNESA